MKKLLIIIYMFLFQFTYGQTDNKITLDYCYKQAAANYPIYKQKELLVSSSNLKLKNLNLNYLPQVNLNGLASYQSDVTNIKIDLPSIIPYELETPKMSKEMYKVTLDLNQIIYDGGTIKKQKELEGVNLTIDQQNVDIELYNLKERVNDIYFYIILLKEKEKLLYLIRDEIDKKLKNVESGIRNGVLLELSADVLKAEIINLDQTIIEHNIDIASAINMLVELISEDIPENTKFELPLISVDFSNRKHERLEYELLSLQQNKIDAIKNVVSTNDNPRFFGFGQVGYGNPGLDMFNDEFDTYYIVGAKLSWNIWNWNQNKNEKQILSIGNEIINSQKELFDKNLKITIEKRINEIQKLEQLILKDLEKIALRGKIKTTTSSQLDNGLITATQYLTELNAEKQALLMLEVHRIQLVKAKTDYLATLGKL